MFYRFSNLAGRVVASSQLAAYRPQGIQVFAGIAKPPVYASKKDQPTRQSSHEVKPGNLDPSLTIVTTMTPRERTMQDACENTFVWRSFGSDVVGYYTAFAVVLSAISFALYTAWKLNNPNKKE